MPQTLSIIVKVVNTCNQACQYCNLPSERVETVQVIPMKIIEKIITGATELGVKNIQFVWHGGEPLLAGLDFYRNAVDLQNRLKKDGQMFDNVMQSNGLLIDEKWVKFFQENKFGVGISIDGPQDVHDRNRVRVGGSPTHHAAVKNFTFLKANDCDGGICAVVNQDSLGHASEAVDFFASLNVPELDFLPCFNSDYNQGSQVKAISADQYADFMIEAFNHWLDLYQPDFQIRFFVHGDIEQDIPEDVRGVAYRLLGESLANIRKHANANSVEVHLSINASEMTIIVEDDGQGFSVPNQLSSLERAQHFGLVSLLEDVRAVKGTLEIDSTIGEGCCLVATIPLSR